MKIVVIDLYAGESGRSSRISEVLGRYAEVYTLQLFSSEFSYELLEPFDAIVLSGSNNMKIYSSPRVGGLKNALVELASEGMSLLGICGGNQVLASIFGYRRYVLRKPEVSWYPIHITKEGSNDPLFNGLKDGFMTFESHILGVRCDDKTKILADNEYCIQAIRYDSNVRGIQFHPEVSPMNRFDDAEKASDVAETEVNETLQEYEGWRIFKNFVQMVKT